MKYTSVVICNIYIYIYIYIFSNFLISLLTVILYMLQYILLQLKNFESEFFVSFVVFAAGKTERLEKHINFADLLQTRVTYQPQN